MEFWKQGQKKGTTHKATHGKEQFESLKTLTFSINFLLEVKRSLVSQKSTENKGLAIRGVVAPVEYGGGGKVG